MADAARCAVSFIRRQLWRRRSARFSVRRYRDGEAAIDGFLDDYAFLIAGSARSVRNQIRIGTISASPLNWRNARSNCSRIASGAHFSARAAQDDLVLRLKDDYDGAEPSGNSAMALGLLRLARMTNRDDFRASAGRTFGEFRAQLKSAGAQVPQMLAAHAMNLAPPVEIVLAGPEDHPSMHQMLASIRRRFLPNAVIIDGPRRSSPNAGHRGSSDGLRLRKFHVPFAGHRSRQAGRATRLKLLF